MNGINRRLRQAFDALAAADADTRFGALVEVAEALEESADRIGGSAGSSDRTAATVVRLIADAGLAAEAGGSGRCLTSTRLEGELGAVLDRMAAERDITCRAAMLYDLCQAIPDADAAETIACLPYAPGMVGWRVEKYQPRSLRGLFQAWKAI